MRAKRGQSPDYEKSAAYHKRREESWAAAQKKRKALKKLVQDQNPLLNVEVQAALAKEKEWKSLWLNEQKHLKKLLATHQGRLWVKAKNKTQNFRRKVKLRLIAEHAKRTPPQVVADFRTLLQADQPKEKTNDTDQR